MCVRVKLIGIKKFRVCIMGVLRVILVMVSRYWYDGYLCVFIVCWFSVDMVWYFYWFNVLSLWGWFREFIVLLVNGIVWE